MRSRRGGADRGRVAAGLPVRPGLRRRDHRPARHPHGARPASRRSPTARSRAWFQCRAASSSTRRLRRLPDVRRRMPYPKDISSPRSQPRRSPAGSSAPAATRHRHGRRLLRRGRRQPAPRRGRPRRAAPRIRARRHLPARRPASRRREHRRRRRRPPRLRLPVRRTPPSRRRCSTPGSPGSVPRRPRSPRWAQGGGQGTMADAGVRVLPELDPDDVTEADLPVLIKASAGGGGPGALPGRYALADLPGEIATARAEAASRVRRPTVFCGKAVRRASRHLEVQVLADSHGTVWSAGGRECSLPRRRRRSSRRRRPRWWTTPCARALRRRRGRREGDRLRRRRHRRVPREGPKWPLRPLEGPTRRRLLVPRDQHPARSSTPS